jgi:hypothetical protein
LLFSQDLPTARNLGFLDSKATELTVPIGDTGQEFTILQSPTLLGSSLSTGTTGAVLWKVTPLFAAWLSDPENFLFASGCLGANSTILELGCGISGIVAMTVSPRVGEYVCTDQEYVLKHIRRNLEANATVARAKKASSSKVKQTSRKSKADAHTTKSSGISDHAFPNTKVLALDWERSTISSLPLLLGPSIDHLDAIVACDCIYNTHLIAPFVQTCSELCRLRADDRPPMLCIVAQQLRSDEVFEEWLIAFSHVFRVWQVPDERLSDGLKPSEGFVVHVGILKDTRNVAT